MPEKSPSTVPAEEDVVNVRDDEVGIRLLQVARRHGVHHARDAADGEHRDEGDGEEHGAGEAQAPAPEGAQPVEDLDPGGDGDQQRADGEEAVGDRAQADGEHVVAQTPQPSQPMSTPEKTITL